MPALVEVERFCPEAERSYLVFCSGNAGWRIGEWQRSNGIGHWSLAFDPDIEVDVTHVIDPSIETTHGVEVLWWIASRQPAWPGQQSPVPIVDASRLNG